LNESTFPFADAIVNKVFLTQLRSAADYIVVHEGDILKLYQQLHILPGQAPNREQMQVIADRLNAQVLVTGVVLEMRENIGEHGSVFPFIVMEIQLRDGRNTETLGITYHHRHGNYYKEVMHFGVLHTVTGLSRQMASEIINLWFKKGLTQCSD
jgi:hypothetical protein